MEDIKDILNRLSKEISRLEIENISLRNAIGKLISEESLDQTPGKVYNPTKELINNQRLRQLLDENTQLKNRLLIHNLTAKEKQVLRLIASGYTNNEIAKKLGRSHHTIISHRKNLLSKLQLNNTAALVQFAAKNGLI